jgi:hypothetical protein
MVTAQRKILKDLVVKDMGSGSGNGSPTVRSNDFEGSH